MTEKLPLLARVIARLRPPESERYQEVYYPGTIELYELMYSARHRRVLKERYRRGLDKRQMTPGVLLRATQPDGARADVTLSQGEVVVLRDALSVWIAGTGKETVDASLSALMGNLDSPHDEGI